jgi:ligand-binding SRPBCC domain-containing protein
MSCVFETEVWLPRPVGEVFPFFADAGNLDLLTPPWLRFEILTPRPIEMKPGALIDYRLRLRGWPFRWRTRITEWQPPVRFVDEQLRGPYRQWIHEHTFVERAGGTVVGDRVRYAVPGGALMNALFVRRDVERIFAYRQSKLQEMFDVAGKRRWLGGDDCAKVGS